MEILKKRFIAKSNRIKIINNLYNKGCNNIYLLYNIYKNTDKNNFYFDNKLNFFASESKSSRELHLFTQNLKYIKEYNGMIQKDHTYLCGSSDTISYYLQINPFISSKILFSEDFYVYKLDINNEYLNFIEKVLKTYHKFKFYNLKQRKNLSRLIPLQYGYMKEEMNYSEKILSKKKFIKNRLYNSYKNFKIYYIEYDDEIISKCEWNAYTNTIFQIGGVYTSPIFRKKGIAKFLILSMIKNCYENNYDKSFLFVRKNNYKAINLYESLGFQKTKDNLKWTIIKKI